MCIVCSFNLFDLDQWVYIVDDGNAKIGAITNLQRLGETIANLSATNNIDNVKLIGNATYASDIVNDIHEHNARYYNNRKINIQVN
jgi:hypothetical protein